MIRLAIVAPQFPEYTVQYAHSMGELCTILAFVDEAQLAVEYAGRSMPVGHPAFIRPLRFKTPVDLLRLLNLVRRFRPHVLHIQEASGPRRAFFTACLTCVFANRTLIVLTIHDPKPHDGRDEVAARRTARIGRYVRRHADVIITHGAYCARLIRGQRLNNETQVIASAHGVILEPQTRNNPDAMSLKLYMFGRMEAYKGLEVLLTAIELLHAEGLPFALTLGGAGPELKRLHDRFNKLPEVTIINGFVPSSDVIASIQACHCVLLPYLSATQSGVLAAAFGGHRCVIASDVGGLPDVVTHEHNGLLVPPKDPHALASAIRRLAGDSLLLARLQAGARATAEGQLSWMAIAQEVYPILSEAARHRTSVPATSDRQSPSLHHST